MINYSNPTLTQKPIPKDGSGLWENYYHVRMRYLHSRSHDYIRNYGVRVSGVPELDQERETEMIDTEMNIDSMFEKWRQGVTIRVVKYEDTYEIYRIIHDHIVSWAEYLETRVNVGNAPLQDLIELDQFASVVYDKAKNLFEPTAKEQYLAGSFSSVQQFNFMNILKKKREVYKTASGAEVQEVSKKPDPIPDRVSFKNMFAENIRLIGGWRGKPDGQ